MFSLLMVLHFLTGNFNFPFNPGTSNIQGNIFSRPKGRWTWSSGGFRAETSFEQLCKTILSAELGSSSLFVSNSPWT